MADLTYNQLTTAIYDLQHRVLRDAEEIRIQALKIEEIADDTTRVAEMIGSMKVDPYTVGETRDLAGILLGIGGAAHSYAAAADVTARTAAAAVEQARTTHGGIDEAVSRAPIDVHDVDREWFRQE